MSHGQDDSFHCMWGPNMGQSQRSHILPLVLVAVFAVTAGAGGTALLVDILE
jgi:hypothetical protein